MRSSSSSAGVAARANALSASLSSCSAFIERLYHRVLEPFRGGRSPARGTIEAAMETSPYDRIARLYDPWSRSVVEDVGFYVSEARKAGGTVVELGVGTGRIAVPVAEAGVPVIGVDSSAGMLEVCRARAEEAGVAA